MVIQKMYDIVFIGYKEEKNWQTLVSKFPTAKRVDGVRGLHQAHRVGAKMCWTKMFWIVDADAVILDNFDFSYVVKSYDEDIVHVWRCVNPINDLTYGYGGVKLFPRDLTLAVDVTRPDMTTSISSKFRSMPQVSNITAFNTDPYNTWKSAFRECTKLSSKIIDRQDNEETEERLNIWCTAGIDKPFGKYAIAGAKAGREYGLKHRGDHVKLHMINNFEWLKEQFNGTV
jgi:hypothetical protein